MSDRLTPDDVAKARRNARESMIQPGERVAAELARIADVLECIRLELVALVDSRRKRL